MYFESVLGVSQVPPGAKVIQREAVRGVVIKDKNLVFMIRTVKGDYKFPGGGVESGENHAAALIREFIEETGYSISNTIQYVGTVIEQRRDAYKADTYFVMKSYYYKCDIKGEKQEQKLEAYEKEQDFNADYVPILDAYKQNRQLLEADGTGINPWVSREMTALKSIIEQLDIHA